MDPQSSKTQVELTVEIEQTVQHCLCKTFIHHASLNFIHHAYFLWKLYDVYPEQYVLNTNLF